MAYRFLSLGIIAAALCFAAADSSARESENPFQLQNKAEALGAAGKYSEAIPYARRALEIMEQRFGQNHPNVAALLNTLASLHQKQGKYKDAEPLFKRSIAILERTRPNDPNNAILLNNLAHLYEDQGRFIDAEQLYKRAIVTWERAVRPNQSEFATVLSNLGALYDQLGRYVEAESLIKHSLVMHEKIFGTNHPEAAIVVNNLAELFRKTGKYENAESSYKRALVIWEKTRGRDHPSIAVILNNMALLYSSQARYADAESLYQRSLIIAEKAFGSDHITVSHVLNNLALVYHAQGRNSEAESLYERALAIRQKFLPPNHFDIAQSLNNLASVYRDLGRVTDAQSLSKRSLEIYESTFGPDSLPTAYALNTLGGLYHLDRRYFEAEPLFKRALAIREKALGSDHHDVAIVLNNLALLYRAQGRYADALRAINQTILASRIDKVVAFPVLFDSQGQGLITPLHAMTDSYAILQLSWSSSAADAVSRLAARFAAGSDALAQLVRKDQDLLAERDALDRNLIVAVGKQISQRNSAVEDQFRNRIEAIKSEREALQKSFAERFPNYVALSKPQPLSLEDTRALLSDDEALVAFDFDKKSYAWVITRADADWVELKITAKELEEQVKALRSSLSFDIDNKPFDTQLAFKIYQETFGTIADKLQGKTRLSVVTNGALTSLPFQLLVTKDPGNKQLKDIDWLVRSYAITNLPSVASLKTLRSTASSSSAAKPMIGFADPIFSKDGSKQVAALRSVVNFYEGGRPDLSSLAKALQQLPETANEVRAIGEVLKADRNDLKLGIFASEATVKQTKLDDYRIVYFATHGLVAGEVEKFAKVKAEPALALTIPDKPTDLDDGLLTASEVAQLKLNAEWVILSACNTAAESNPGAEALSGLARAFFYAGARSLVVSHWEVDSDASVKLMTKMFQTMATDPKLSHAEALRQSMLAMVASAGSDHDAHPRLWAPFVVVGEPAKPH